MGDEADESGSAWRRVAAPAAVVAAVLIAAALVSPWGATGFDDDWGYIAITRELAQTGQFRIHGWIATLLLGQAVVGAAAIRIAGESADVLRATTMLWNACGVLAAYALTRRLGASRATAAFAALSIGLSPLAIPLGVSYMSDVPGMAACLVCTLVGAIAFDAAGRGARAGCIVALAGVAASGYAAGTIRQVAWGVPAAVLAVFAWRHRALRAEAAAAVACLGTLILSAWWTLRWFESLPNSSPLVGDDRMAVLAHPKSTALSVAACFLTLALLLAPTAWALAGGRLRGCGRPSLLRVAALGAGASAVLALRPEFASPPWIGNTMYACGVLGPDTCAGTRPDALPGWLRTLAFAVAAAPIALFLTGSLSAPRRSATAPTGRLAVLSAAAALALGTGAHLLMSGRVFDRYLMPIAALTTIAVLTHPAIAPSRRPGAAGWTTLCILAAYGVATAHDYFELLRARASAVERAASLGIDRSRVCAGYELDGEYQLERAQHVDGVVPAFTGAHDGCPPPSPHAERLWTLKLTTHVQPTHFVVTSLQDWLDPEPVAEVAYGTWLPPGTARVWVQRERAR